MRVIKFASDQGDESEQLDYPCCMLGVLGAECDEVRMGRIFDEMAKVDE
jgi:hypothetical protein